MPKKNVIAIVPARGGSKGLPGKNLRDFCGNSLVAHTVLVALECASIDQIIISSDSKRILRAGEDAGGKPHYRHPALATDNATTDVVIADVFENLNFSNAADTIVVILQPTSPLRTSKQIFDALELYKSSSCELVASVCEAEKHPMKAFRESAAGYLEGFMDIDSPFMPRQQFETAYYANGAIYIFSLQSFLRHQCIPRTNILPFIMTQTDSIDIDNEFELHMAQMIYKEREAG